MDDIRVPLYSRLPEIYRIKDFEIFQTGQLKSYLAAVEKIFSALHYNIESLYNDLFIETCDDWVIPYIGDLLGTSHLSGESRTLRADVADTIALRRRKGTIGAIEKLTYDLTDWGVHCKELRENLVWNQNINHLRPDMGGISPFSPPLINIETVIRGGTANLRNPAALSLLNTPFDTFAHVADVKAPLSDDIYYNLPNLAIFLWRLEDFKIGTSKPFFKSIIDLSATAVLNEAKFIVSFYLHPLGELLILFNTNKYDPEANPPVITLIDETPGTYSGCEIK